MTTAGRKSLPAIDNRLPELVPNAGALMLNDVNSANDIEKEAVFSAGVDLGRIEALDFVSTVVNSAILPIYENVKKSKAWKHLRNPQSSDGRNFESLNEFCEVKLGKSYTRLQELAANRRLIGHDAYDQAEKMGLRQVDYNAIKTLPAPDQELIRQAVSTQSRDEVLDLLQELASRHAQAAQKLTKELADVQADLAASESRRSVLITENDKLKTRIARATPDDVLLELQKETTRLTNDALGCVQGQLRQAFIALKNHGDGTADHSLFMAGLVGQVQFVLAELREEFNLPDISNARDQELAAEVAQWAPKN